MPILGWIRSRKIDTGLLSSFFIFLISADWDKDPHRNGFVRLSDADLSKIWCIPVSTFRRWRGQLVSAGLMEKLNDCYRIIRIDLFAFSGAREFSGKVTNEEIGRLFPDVVKNQPHLETEYSKMEESEPETPPPFDNSFKKNFRGVFTQKEVARNEGGSFTSEIARRKDKIERPGLFGIEEERLIDEIVEETPEMKGTAKQLEQLERDVKETLF